MRRSLSLLVAASMYTASSAFGCGTTEVPIRLVSRADFLPLTNAQAGAKISVQVNLDDKNGVRVAGATLPVTIGLANNPGGGTLTGTTTVTSTDGAANFSVSIDKAASGYTFSVTSPGLPTSTSLPFSVLPGPPAKLSPPPYPSLPPSISSGPFQSGRQAKYGPVTVEDIYGNKTPDFTGNVTLAFGNNPSGAILSGPLTVPALAGAATFTGIVIDKPGTGFTFVITSPGLTNATSATFDVLLPPQSFTTNFSGTENPLSENGIWTDGSVGLNWDDVQKNGFAYATTFASSVDDNVACLTTAFTRKQYAQGTVKRDGGYSPSNSHEIELLLLFAISGSGAGTATGYEINWSYAGNVQIIRWNGGFNDFTVLTTLTMPAPADGDVLRAEVDNSGVITVYLNSTSKGSTTDTTFTTGQPGIGFFVRSPGTTLSAFGWKSFSAGSLL
jgi:hypothetical protein